MKLYFSRRNRLQTSWRSIRRSPRSPLSMPGKVKSWSCVFSADSPSKKLRKHYRFAQRPSCVTGGSRRHGCCGDSAKEHAMEPERWHQIEFLYHAAQGREPCQRDSFLKEACAGDDELLGEVESLLGYGAQAESFNDISALEVTAKALAEDR